MALSYTMVTALELAQHNNQLSIINSLYRFHVNGRHNGLMTHLLLLHIFDDDNLKFWLLLLLDARSPSNSVPTLTLLPLDVGWCE